MKESVLKVKLPSPHDKSMGIEKTTIRASRTPMEYVHVNKGEIKHLDHLQGGHKENKHGVAEYSGLSPLFMHKPFLHSMYKAARAHHAKGGNVRNMASKGRHGDTCMAYMPSHVADHFDKMMGGECRNPQTKKREYFSLSGMLSGASKYLPQMGQAAAAAAPAIANAAAPAAKAASSWMPSMSGIASGIGKAASSAGSALGKAGSAAASAAKTYGPGVMAAAGKGAQALAPVAAQYGMQYLNNKMNPEQATNIDYNQLYSDATGAIAPQFGEGAMGKAYEGVRQGVGSMMQGNDWRTGLSTGLNAGTQGMQDPYSSAARGAASNYASSGGDWRQGLAGGVGGGTQGMEDPYSRAARGATSAYAGSGGDWRSGMAGGINEGTQGMEDPYSRAARGASTSYARSGGDPRRAIASGVGAGTQGYNDPYSRMARGAASAYGNPDSGYGDVARGAFNGYTGGNPQEAPNRSGYGNMSPGSSIATSRQGRGAARSTAALPAQRNMSGMVSPAGLWGDESDF